MELMQPVAYPGLDPKPEAKSTPFEAMKVVPPQPLAVDISVKKVHMASSPDIAHENVCNSGSTDYSFASPRTLRTMSTLTTSTSAANTPSHHNQIHNTSTNHTSAHHTSPSSLLNSSVEVFVGDLSFFCKEYDLYDLFSRFGYVLKTRIKRSERDTRTLMYGFVVMQKLEEAQRAVEALHGFRFLGRDIRVELSKVKDPSDVSTAATTVQTGNSYHTNHAHNGPEFQVHVAFTSFFQYPDIIKPREALLRQIFESAGLVKDVAIKEYTIHKEINKQEGFCFVSFFTIEDASRAVELIDHKMFSGFIFECTLSYHNPGMHGNGNGGSHHDYHNSPQIEKNKKYHHHHRTDHLVPDAIGHPPSVDMSMPLDPSMMNQGFIPSVEGRHGDYGLIPDPSMMYSMPIPCPPANMPMQPPPGSFHPLVIPNGIPPPQSQQQMGLSYFPIQAPPSFPYQPNVFPMVPFAYGYPPDLGNNGAPAMQNNRNPSQPQMLPPTQLMFPAPLAYYPPPVQGPPTSSSLPQPSTSNTTSYSNPPPPPLSPPSPPQSAHSYAMIANRSIQQQSSATIQSSPGTVMYAAGGENPSYKQQYRM